MAMDLRTVRGLDVPQKVREWANECADGKKHFASYLEYIDGEIVERVFAARSYKGKGLRITEVYRNATGTVSPVVKNLTYSKMAGYTPIFEPKDVFCRSGGYPFMVFSAEDFDVWDNPAMPIGIWRTYINSDLLKEIGEFKYSGFSGGDVIDYLNRYRRDNSVEFIGKLGLPLSQTLMSRMKADKQFRRFVIDHHIEVPLWGVQATIYAYEHNVSIERARNICFVKNQNDRMIAKLVPEVRGTKIDRQRLMDYLEDIGDAFGGEYDDYLRAIKLLKLDLNDTKNVFPKDFRRMHDQRAAEYASAKAKLDKKKRAELYRDFAKKAEELQRYSFDGEVYSIIIPSAVSDLINEGEKLSHCVGKMGYDKKVVDGVSMIAFVRKKGDIDTPFVTAEYRFDEKKLRQCYGKHDTKPPDDVLEFVNEWAKKVRIGGDT